MFFFRSLLLAKSFTLRANVFVFQCKWRNCLFISVLIAYFYFFLLHQIAHTDLHVSAHTKWLRVKENNQKKINKNEGNIRKKMYKITNSTLSSLLFALQIQRMKWLMMMIWWCVCVRRFRRYHRYFHITLCVGKAIATDQSVLVVLNFTCLLTCLLLSRLSVILQKLKCGSMCACVFCSSMSNNSMNSLVITVYDTWKWKSISNRAWINELSDNIHSIGKGHLTLFE